MYSSRFALEHMSNALELSDLMRSVRNLRRQSPKPAAPIRRRPRIEVAVDWPGRAATRFSSTVCRALHADDRPFDARRRRSRAPGSAGDRKSRRINRPSRRRSSRTPPGRTSRSDGAPVDGHFVGHGFFNPCFETKGNGLKNPCHDFSRRVHWSSLFFRPGPGVHMTFFYRRDRLLDVPGAGRGGILN